MGSSRFFNFGSIAGCVLVSLLAGCSTDPDGNAMGNVLGAGTGGVGFPPIAGQSGTPPMTAGTGGSTSVGQAGTGVAGTGVAGAAGTGVAGTASMAGTGGVGGTAGSQAGSDGTAGSAGGMEPEPAECVKGVIEPHQVVLIGDSYLAFGAMGTQGIGGIQRQVEARAVEAGVLTATEHYRNYYVSGTRFLNDTIQNQWTMAKAANPDIKVVLMNGGGNDVLQGMEGCFIFNNPEDAVCIEVVERSTAACALLFADMQTSGVEKIVFFFYPDVPLAPGHSEFDEPYAREGCDALVSPMSCHFVSTLAAFDGQASLIAGDGIHPTAAGQVVIGDLMWESMVENCVAQ